jgi:exo-beta-1,3-glucanase (GH17 family)
MIPYGRAVCYSGYRNNQSPLNGTYPSEKEVLEDLRLLSGYYDYIRMYDISPHARTVLETIRTHNIPLKVMLGVEPKGEISNPACPWGGLHSDEDIARHKNENIEALDALVVLAERYKDIVLAVSVGNESTSPWHGNLMAPETIHDHAAYVKGKTSLPVTFCEGADVFLRTGKTIAPALDVISVHSYPLWHRVPVKDAVERTIRDITDVRKAFPGKEVIVTEYGWTTRANDKMDSSVTDEKHQDDYLRRIDLWKEETQTTMFVFEAFDEPWKGSDDPDEPEKHWGLWTVGRKPKRHARHIMETNSPSPLKR